ncbi:MAG: hypothetical protein Aureis2KO_04370 [Aureisphaera sp.]
MEMYLLKSAACLAILYAFYKLFLERENMHTLKRFYLLGILVVSYTIPFITFTEYVEAQPVLTTPIITSDYIPITIIEETQPNYLMMALWVIFIGGVTFFGGRFGKNIFAIIQKIRKNPRFKDKNIFKVLLKAPTTPHTFFSYIFLNQTAFEANEIPKEVLDHEEVHARELHSLDVLFIELLLIVFWFNPLLHLIRRSIKLNHEFLADRAVLKTGIDASDYQNTLLAFSSNACSPSLANSINYSFIKKRITVMKKHTSQTGTWVRSLVVIPLLALLVYGFSSTQQVEKENDFVFAENTESSKLTARSMEIAILDDGTYLVDGIQATRSTLASVAAGFHQDINAADRNRILNIHIVQPKEVLNEEVQFIFDTLWDYGFYRLVAPNQEVVRGKGNTPFAPPNSDTRNSYVEDVLINEGDNTTLVSEQNLKATDKEIREYNRLAKKYNEMPRDNMFIVKEEIKRLKYIYDKMTEKQRASAEPFPNIPPPPPPPPAPDAIDAPEANTWVPDPVKDIPPPPPPPAPESPLEHVKKMAGKGAIFYYEGKKITASKAISLVKQDNDQLNIQSSGYNSSKPTVKISKEPIYLRKQEVKEDGNEHGPNPSMSNSIKGKPVNINIQTSNLSLKTGNVEINGEDYFYTTKNGVTSYFNQNGEPVDSDGKPLAKPTKRTPTYYLNGQKISAAKANQLLSNNRSIQVTNKEYSNGEYAVLLTDLNTHNPNQQAQDPLIDLTDVISKGAIFFLNDKRISQEKAVELTKKPDAIERVSVVKGDDGKPKVYFWSKAQKGTLKTTKTSFGPSEDPAKIISEMMQEGALFFLSGKSISGEEAKKLIREDQVLQLDLRQNEDGTMEVHLNGC